MLFAGCEPFIDELVDVALFEAVDVGSEAFDISYVSADIEGDEAWSKGHGCLLMKLEQCADVRDRDGMK